ncbi:MAG: hypothetical protein ACJ8F3_00260 [Xanthobacteraceae bacterium]
MKVLYAIAFALFPLTAPAQSLDTLLLTALCHDDYFEDAGGQCKALAAAEDVTFEAIVSTYGEIVSDDAAEAIVSILIDSGDEPVGTIQPRVSPLNNGLAADDDETSADRPSLNNTVSTHIETIEFPREQDQDLIADASEVATTGPVPAGPAISEAAPFEEN